MGLAMDPERRRRLVELSRWHDEWSARHASGAGLPPEQTERQAAPDSDDNLHHGDVSPTPDAEREFMTRAREIMGLDPETGHRRS